MAKAYFTLLAKREGKWVPVFGDYYKSVVSDEEYDCYDTEVTRIIRTDDNQVAIDARIAELNTK